MGQCFLDYDGLKQFWKVVKDNFVRLGKDGSITVNAIRKSDSSNDFVLLAGGGVKPLSEFGSGSSGSGSSGSMSTLTIQGNGTTLGTYNGSSDKTVNLTYANIGAAPTSHTTQKATVNKLGHIKVDSYLSTVSSSRTIPTVSSPSSITIQTPLFGSDNKYYPVSITSDGYAFVNIPWTDTKPSALTGEEIDDYITAAESEV